MSRFSLLVVACLSVGCARLTVQVDIANPGVVDEAVAQRLIHETLPDALLQHKKPEIVLKVVAATEAQHRARYTASTSIPQASSQNPSAASAIEGVQQKERFANEVEPLYAAVATALTQVNHDITTTYQSRRDCYDNLQKYFASPWRDRRRNARPICGAAGALGDPLVQLLALRETHLKSLRDLPSVGVETPPRPAEPLTSLIGSDSLFRSQQAYVVSHAPDDMWVEEFDRSRAVARFGNINVAIKMEQRGNFTIKGLSFDPSDVARIASKVMTQSILTWTRMSGVPVAPSAERRDDNAVLRALTSAEELQAQRDAQTRSRDDALVMLAGTLVNDAKRLTADDATRRSAAVDAAVKVWEANRSRFLPQTTREADAKRSKLWLLALADRVYPGRSAQLVVGGPADKGDLVVGLSVDRPPATLAASKVTVAKGAHAANTEITVPACTEIGEAKITASAADFNEESLSVKVGYPPLEQLKDMQVKAGSEQEVTIKTPVTRDNDAVVKVDQNTGYIDVTPAPLKFENTTEAILTIEGRRVRSTPIDVTVLLPCTEPAKFSVSVLPVELSFEEVAATTPEPSTKQYRIKSDSVLATDLTITLEADPADVVGLPSPPTVTLPKGEAASSPFALQIRKSGKVKIRGKHSAADIATIPELELEPTVVIATPDTPPSQ